MQFEHYDCPPFPRQGEQEHHTENRADTQYSPLHPSFTIPGILDHLVLDEIPETRDLEARGALDCLNAGVRVLYEKKATSVLVREVTHSNKVTSNHFS